MALSPVRSKSRSIHETDCNIIYASSSLAKKSLGFGVAVVRPNGNPRTLLSGFFFFFLVVVGSSISSSSI